MRVHGSVRSHSIGRGAIRLLKPTAVLALVGSVLAVGFASVAGAAPVGGAVKVFGVPGMGARSPILFTGAIGDYGKAIRQNANGVANRNGNFVKFSLTQGTFIGNGTALFKKLNTAPPTAFDNATCSGAFTASAAMPLGSGTGAYAGIGGSLNLHVTFAFVGPRFKSGKHKGQCNGNANPLAQMGTISGGGTVSVG
jgi:hypothetical protein